MAVAAIEDARRTSRTAPRACIPHAIRQQLRQLLNEFACDLPASSSPFKSVQHAAGERTAVGSWTGMQVRIEVLGPYQFLAVCRVANGDYHELACSSICEATQRVEQLAKCLGLLISHMEIPEDAKTVNSCGGERWADQRRSKLAYPGARRG